MKKILFFCLYCAIFTLIPAASIMAGGEKDTSHKPFPGRDMPAEEGDTFYLSEIASEGDEESFLDSETTAVNEDKDPLTPETSVLSENNPSPVPETTVVNEEKPSPAPKKTAVSNENKGTDKNLPGSADAHTAAAAPPPPQPQPAQSPPPAPQPAQAQPAPSRTQPQPQPPVRTIAPTVNIIMPPAAAPAAPPAYTPSIRVVPGMPDPHGNGVYRVQLGAFSNTVNAQQCFDRLKSANFTPYYEQYGSLYRVVITGIEAADMDAVIRRLEAAGFREVWIREER